MTPHSQSEKSEGDERTVECLLLYTREMRGGQTERRRKREANFLWVKKRELRRVKDQER